MKTRAEVHPPLFCMAGIFVTSICWTAHGSLQSDIPLLLGGVLTSFVQLFLICTTLKFGKNKIFQRTSVQPVNGGSDAQETISIYKHETKRGSVTSQKRDEKQERSRKDKGKDLRVEREEEDSFESGYDDVEEDAEHESRGMERPPLNGEAMLSEPKQGGKDTPYKKSSKEDNHATRRETHKMRRTESFPTPQGYTGRERTGKVKNISRI